MKPFRLSWLYLLGVLPGIACSRDSMPTMEQQLVGRWEWVQSKDATGTGPATPATTGHTVVVEFDRRGRARFYQDGAMIGAAKFRLKSIGTGWRKSKNVIIYRGYKSQQFYTVSGNKLILQDADNSKAGSIYYKGQKRPYAELAGKP